MRGYNLEHRTLAISMVSFIQILTNDIPVPETYGYLFDSSCILWDKQCSITGDANCLEYDTWHLRLGIFLINILFMSTAAALYIGSYYKMKQKEIQISVAKPPA